MRIFDGLKTIILTPFAFWKEILFIALYIAAIGFTVWFWVLVIKALLKYLAS